jgi:hypothetical protein
VRRLAPMRKCGNPNSISATLLFENKYHDIFIVENSTYMEEMHELYLEIKV